MVRLMAIFIALGPVLCLAHARSRATPFTDLAANEGSLLPDDIAELVERAEAAKRENRSPEKVVRTAEEAGDVHESILYLLMACFPGFFVLYITGASDLLVEWAEKRGVLALKWVMAKGGDAWLEDFPVLQQAVTLLGVPVQNSQQEAAPLCKMAGIQEMSDYSESVIDQTASQLVEGTSTDVHCDGRSDQNTALASFGNDFALQDVRRSATAVAEADALELLGLSPNEDAPVTQALPLEEANEDLDML